MTSAEEILALRDKEAAALFGGDVRKGFRKLAAEWHPDRSRHPRASEVFARLTALRDVALGRKPLAASSAKAASGRIYRTADGRTVKANILSASAGPLGEVLVGRSTLSYEYPEEFADVAEAEAARLKAGFRFADDAMRREMERFLPQLERTLEADGKRVTVLRRPADAVLLSDLTAHMGGRIPAVHVAWIVSGMLNIASYLNWAGISHGSVATSTMLVCPQFHSVILAGGWGFATEFGKRPPVLPERTLSAVPRLALPGELPDPSVDLQLVRATALEMLGCPGGGGLAFDRETPAPMKNWLLLPPLADAFADYAGWSRCLDESFGKRRFVDMGVAPSDVYGN